MIVVYAETNFILEIALLQEQNRDCQQLLTLAETTKLVRLVLPAFSFSECYETMTRRSKERDDLVQRFRPHVRQMGRSAPYREVTPAWESVAAQLLAGSKEEWDRLRQLNAHLLDLVEVIPQTAEIIRMALRYERQYELTPQDAIVYASVIQHIRTLPVGPKIFLNRNSKDFDDPDIQQELDSYSCKILFNFTDGLSYLSRLLR